MQNAATVRLHQSTRLALKAVPHAHTQGPATPCTHSTHIRILDNLPVAMVKMRKDEKTGNLVKLYERGFPVGFSAVPAEVRASLLSFERAGPLVFLLLSLRVSSVN